LAAASKQKIA